MIWFWKERCILLEFYIKPQQKIDGSLVEPSCILLEFYIKPQLQMNVNINARGCILLEFYIKPQQGRENPREQVVVYY